MFRWNRGTWRNPRWPPNYRNKRPVGGSRGSRSHRQHACDGDRRDSHENNADFNVPSTDGPRGATIHLVFGQPAQPLLSQSLWYAQPLSCQFSGCILNAWLPYFTALNGYTEKVYFVCTNGLNKSIERKSSGWLPLNRPKNAVWHGDWRLSGHW